MGVGPGCVFDKLFASWAETSKSRSRIIVSGGDKSFFAAMSNLLFLKIRRVS